MYKTQALDKSQTSHSSTIKVPHIFTVYTFTIFKEIRESIDMHFLFLPEDINDQKKVPFFSNFHRREGLGS